MTQQNTKNLMNKQASVIVRRHKGNIEQKLEKLAETIYNEGEKRFELEVNNNTTPRQKKEILSRRQKKIQRVKKKKKQLHKRWIEAKEEEKEGLKILYEEVKKKHRDLLSKERYIKRRKEKERTRKEFVKDPYKFSKSIFTESKSVTLKFTKEKFEAHVKETYIDPDRKKRFPYISNLNKPTSPGIPFNMSDIKKMEVDEFITKARCKSSPGNDGVSYKVYKKCPRL